MAAYALEPVEALDTMAVDAVRRIYEEGFPDRLRADFASLTDQREAGEAALALVRGPQPYGFAMLRRLGRWVDSHFRFPSGDRSRDGRRLERELLGLGAAPVITKCCLLEDRVVSEPGLVVVPWGASLAQIREGLQLALSAVQAVPQ